jgi:hypothetical protein
MPLEAKHKDRRGKRVGLHDSRAITVALRRPDEAGFRLQDRDVVVFLRSITTKRYIRRKSRQRCCHECTGRRKYAPPLVRILQAHGPWLSVWLFPERLDVAAEVMRQP